MMHKTQFDNGATVITYPRPGTSAAVGLWMENGTRHQRQGEDGYAHLLEHLLFRGAGELSSTALAVCLDGMGGRIMANLTLVQDNPYGLMEQLAREHFYLGAHPSLEDYRLALGRVTREAVIDALARAWPQRLEIIWTPP